MKILIIEDEKRLAASLALLLKSRGYETEIVHDGEEGYDYAMLGIYDLILLDVMLPSMDGFTIARKLRDARIESRILMLTARSEVTDRISGLNSGADYYLPKPFDNEELLACVSALLRRQGDALNELHFGDLVLDLGTANLKCRDRNLGLSAREFDVMRLLMKNAPNNLSKETILTRVWGYDSNAVENHVEVYIGFLRKKLNNLRSQVEIVTVRRLGYHLEYEDDSKT